MLSVTADVGKSSILRRFMDTGFKNIIPPTTTPEFVSQTVSISDLPIKLEIWDTSGSETYMSITRNYYRNCAGAFLVYDITNATSFANMVRWYQEVQSNSNHENLTFVLIGNKSDLAVKYYQV